MQNSRQTFVALFVVFWRHGVSSPTVLEAEACNEATLLDYTLYFVYLRNHNMVSSWISLLVWTRPEQGECRKKQLNCLYLLNNEFSFYGYSAPMPTIVVATGLTSGPNIGATWPLFKICWHTLPENMQDLVSSVLVDDNLVHYFKKNKMTLKSMLTNFAVCPK